MANAQCALEDVFEELLLLFFFHSYLLTNSLQLCYLSSRSCPDETVQSNRGLIGIERMPDMEFSLSSFTQNDTSRLFRSRAARALNSRCARRFKLSFTTSHLDESSYGFRAATSRSNSSCPRLQNRPTLMCDIIEDKGLPFPACCPRMICQRHKKAPASTVTKPRTFTPHATVDEELRRIPFVLKRFLEVHNTTLLDAIILSRIKALEKQAKRSNFSGEIQSGDALITYAYFGNNSTENHTTTVTTEAATDIVETTTNVTTSTTTQSDSSPTTTLYSTTAGTPEIAITTTETPDTKTESFTIEGRKGLESVSLEVSPLDNTTVDEDFPILNDAPLAEEEQATATAEPSIKTTTIASTQNPTTTVQTTTVDTTRTTISKYAERPTTTLASTPTTTLKSTTSTTIVTTTSAAATTTEAPTTIFPVTTTEAAGERRTTKPLTVPEFVFPTSTQTSATVLQADQPQPTTSSAPQTPRSRKESNLPTIIRSLVDNVFDYYDYIDYYVPGRKRNFTQVHPQDDTLPSNGNSPAAQSVMELIKERLDEGELANITANTQTNEELSSAGEDIPQGDEASKQDEPVIVTSDPVEEEKRRQELASKLTVENLRREPIDSTTTPVASEAVTTSSAQEPNTTVATRTVPIAIFATTPATAAGIATISPITTPSTAIASQPTSTLSRENPATITTVSDDLKTFVSRKGDTTTAPFTTVPPTTSKVPPTIAVPPTVSPSTPPPNSQETTVVADLASTTPVTTEQADGQPSTTTEHVEENSAVSTTSEKSSTTAEATTGSSTTQIPTTSESPTTRPQTTTTLSSTTSVSNIAAPTTESSTTNKTTTQRSTTLALTTESFTTISPTPEATQTAQPSTDPPRTTTEGIKTRQSERFVTVASTQATNEAPTSVSADTTASTSDAVATPGAPQAPSLNELAGFQADQPIPATRNTTTVQPKNDDVEYIDYVYYYDYVDLPETNATTNDTATSSTPIKATSLQQDIIQ